MGVDQFEGEREYVDAAGIDEAETWTLRDERTREFVLEGVRGVSSLVRSTFGPRGLEKLVETEDPQGEPEIVHTGDSGEIFAAIERGDGFNHPVAALFVDSVDSMQRSLSDGGTTAVVLAAELVERGYDLVEQGLHPNTVTVGYAMAAARAGEILDELARPVTADDSDVLCRVAATAMGDAPEPADRERYAEMVADAVERIADAADSGFVDTENAKVIATTHDSTRRYDGLVVRRWPRGAETSDRSTVDFDWTPSIPDPIEDARVAVLDSEIDFEETATNVDGGVSLPGREAFERYRDDLERRRAAAARGLAESGVDVLVSQPRVDDSIVEAFERENVRVVDGVETPEVDVHRLATLSGATVVSHLDDLTADRLGTVGRVSERRVGDEKWTTFEGGAGGIRSLVVGTKTEADARRMERVVSDALDVTAIAAMDGQVLPGAGAPMMAVATGLRGYARSVPDAEQLAVEAFADAVEGTCSVLLRNAGLDPIDGRTALRTRHAAADGPAPVGMDLESGDPLDAYEAGIVAPRRVFSQAVETARSAAENLVTTDVVLHPNVDLGAFDPQTEHD